MVASVEKNRFAYLNINEKPEYFSQFETNIRTLLEDLYNTLDDYIERVRKGELYKSFLLSDRGTIVAILVYEKVITERYKPQGVENSLGIKSCFVIHPENNSGRGCGTELIKKITAVAKKKGATGIHLTVSEEAPEAKAFFVSRGFKIVHAFDGLYKEGCKEYLCYFPLSGK